MPKRRWLTPSQFAREAGVSPSEITQSVKRGRITATIRDGKKRIDSKTELPKFLATVKHAGHLKATAKDQAPKSGPTARKKTAEKKPPKTQPPTAAPKEFNPLVKAREIQERYKAIEVARDHEIRAGNLVKTDEVVAEFRSIAAMLKKAITNIPDRIAPLVAAEKTRKRCWDILDQECRIILEDLSNAIRNSQHSGGA